MVLPFLDGMSKIWELKSIDITQLKNFFEGFLERKLTYCVYLSCYLLKIKLENVEQWNLQCQNTIQSTM